ncbi:flagellar protein FlgN [Lysinibacillus sp. MHQ-1]|nr:flagellar protein FlgN [Lysinibacillus sp. MHQ-1]
MLKDEQAHVAAIDKLEQQRQKQVTDYLEAKGLASTDKTTVADVIEAAEQQTDKATLSVVRDRLLQIINDLRKQNDLNQKLVFQSLQIVNLTLDAVRPRTEQMNYSSNEVLGTNNIAKKIIFRFTSLIREEETCAQHLWV